jgi:hypothetical protein
MMYCVFRRHIKYEIFCMMETPGIWNFRLHVNENQLYKTLGISNTTSHRNTPSIRYYSETMQLKT